MDQVTFSQAVEGYVLYAHARQLSKHTLADYQNTFRKFEAFLDPRDPPIDEITLGVVEAFFGGLTGL